MIITGFRRSFSLPGRNPNSGAAKVVPQPVKSLPIRSISLPSRGNQPGIAKLEEELVAAVAWHSSGEAPSSSWMSSGLVHLELLHFALAEVLSLPQTQEALRRSRSDPSFIAEKLLDDLLLFADAHGSLRLALVSLQELQSAAEAALRRRDGERLASVGRSLRKAEKEIVALAAALEKAETELLLPRSNASDSELAMILREVKSVSVLVSSAVFRGVAAAVSLAAAVLGCKSSSWNGLKRRSPLPLPSPSKKGALTGETAAAAAVADMGECLKALEIPSEKTFRRLMNARVSVLNILTP